MGLGEWWGGSYKTIPGTNQDIANMAGLQNQAQQWGQGVGLGFAGRQAKSVLKAMGQGNFDSNPIISAYLNPIRNQTETAKRDLIRRASMGVNRIAPGQQAGLLSAQTNLAANRADEQGGMAMQAMIPQLYGQMSNTYGQARGQRIGAEEYAQSEQDRLAQMQNQARLAGSYKTGGFKGFLNDIGGIAGSVAGGMMGMPKLGGSGAYDSSTFPGICWVAGVLYGEGGPEQALIRHYLLTNSSRWAKLFVTFYRRIGERWAKAIKVNLMLRAFTQGFFNALLMRARQCV
jgi:hypothetical protein